MSQVTYISDSSVGVLEDRVKQLEERSKDLEASIAYASRLQQAILPNEILFKTAFEDAFVMYNPKDMVSGDFYWIFENERNIYFAVGDCTGHGIPGAMLNIAGNTILQQYVKTTEEFDVTSIVKRLDIGISALFNENLTTGLTRDGMDLAFCSLDKETNVLSYCGAGRPLILVSDGELTKYKSNNTSIGYSEYSQEAYSSIEIQLKKRDQIYLYSDGYTDQFGGDNIKKFNRKRFRTLLTSLSEMSLDKQRKELEFAFENWKGQQEQIDDVCVVGVKV